MLRPGKAGTNHRITNIAELQNCLGPAKEKILFLHAISGCDTTSFLFNKGKKASLAVLRKSPQLFEELSLFYATDASKPEIVKAGIKFLLKLYNAKHTLSLNELRYFMYLRITSRQVLSSQFNLAVLPPTEKSAEQHLLRVYYQVIGIHFFKIYALVFIHEYFRFKNGWVITWILQHGVGKKTTTKS